jgi:hypothetical protein
MSPQRGVQKLRKYGGDSGSPTSQGAIEEKSATASVIEQFSDESYPEKTAEDDAQKKEREKKEEMKKKEEQEKRNTISGSLAEVTDDQWPLFVTFEKLTSMVEGMLESRGVLAMFCRSACPTTSHISRTCFVVLNVLRFIDIPGLIRNFHLKPKQENKKSKTPKEGAFKRDDKGTVKDDDTGTVKDDDTGTAKDDDVDFEEFTAMWKNFDKSLTTHLNPSLVMMTFLAFLCLQ